MISAGAILSYFLRLDVHEFLDRIASLIRVTWNDQASLHKTI